MLTPRSTLHHTTAEVRSQFGGRWSQIIRNKIESYGIGKFEGNTEKVGELITARNHAHGGTSADSQARKGMSMILGLLRNRELQLGSGEPKQPPAE